MNESPSSNEQLTSRGPRINFSQILLLFLSVYVLGALMIQTFFTLPTEVNRLLTKLDTYILCGFPDRLLCPPIPGPQ